MKTPFTFEAEPFPAASVTAYRETNFEEPGEQFLGDLWDSVTRARIEDRTAFTPRAKRKSVRDIKKVYALVLHQMAFSRGSNPAKYDTVTAHYAILPDGKILQLHPNTAYLWASNGFNPGGGIGQRLECKQDRSTRVVVDALDRRRDLGRAWPRAPAAGAVRHLRVPRRCGFAHIRLTHAPSRPSSVDALAGAHVR
jgi:hypothetical protein